MIEDYIVPIVLFFAFVGLPVIVLWLGGAFRKEEKEAKV